MKKVLRNVSKFSKYPDCSYFNFLKSQNFSFKISQSKNENLKPCQLDAVLSPVQFLQSQINKNALLIQNSEYMPRIIFPEYKFSLTLDISKDDYTIKNMLDDARKIYNQEFVLSLSFIDEEGELIANTVQVKMLTRLPSFKICVDGGDKLFNCLNQSWNAQTCVDHTVHESQLTEKYLELIEKLMFEHNFSFKVAQNLVLQNNDITTRLNQHRYPSFRDILNDYLQNKYINLKNFTQSLAMKREQRLQKGLNFFFYMCFAQVATLNLCTFVFFSWDFMEPITQCITYLNIIFGYYFWAITNEDYEMESMIQWIRRRKFLTKPAMWRQLMNEKEDIEKLL
jgi:hypothetical protein